jgi:hypothetical protein
MDEEGDIFQFGGKEKSGSRTREYPLPQPPRLTVPTSGIILRQRNRAKVVERYYRERVLAQGLIHVSRKRIVAT